VAEKKKSPALTRPFNGSAGPIVPNLLCHTVSGVPDGPLRGVCRTVNLLGSYYVASRHLSLRLRLCRSTYVLYCPSHQKKSPTEVEPFPFPRKGGAFTGAVRPLSLPDLHFHPKVRTSKSIIPHPQQKKSPTEVEPFPVSPPGPICAGRVSPLHVSGYRPCMATGLLGLATSARFPFTAASSIYVYCLQLGLRVSFRSTHLLYPKKCPQSRGLVVTGRIYPRGAIKNILSEKGEPRNARGQLTGLGRSDTIVSQSRLYH